MTGRSIASVVVSFGVTSVGVKLYLSASSDRKSVEFHKINSKTGNRLKQQMVDSITNETVPSNEIVKGYEYKKDSYVLFTDEEIADMAAEKKDTLDISEFVPLSQINQLAIEKTYYLGPDKGMDKVYSLLFQTLLETNSAAVGIWVSRGKEHLIIITPFQHGLIAHQMFYATDVRTFDNTCAKVQLSPIEIELSKLLVEKLTKPIFDMSNYRDSFVDKVKKAVSIKLDGGQFSKTIQKPALGASVEAMRSQLIALGVSESEVNDRIKRIEATVGSAKPESLPKKKSKKTA